MKSESWDGIHPAGAITWGPPSSWKREQHLLKQPVVTKVHLRKVTQLPSGGVSSLWIIHSLNNCSRLSLAKTTRNYFYLQCLCNTADLHPQWSLLLSVALISLQMDSPSPRCFLACPASCPCFCLPDLVPASHCATLIPVYKAVASNTLS